MSSTATDQVLDKLREHGSRVTGTGNRSWNAQCPAHEDRNPSLHVTRGSDRVLLNCHGGCVKEDVVVSLGLTMADLFDEPLERPTGSADNWMPCTRNGHVKIAEYSYYDEQGTQLYAVNRCDHKCFIQWQPDSTAKYGRRWNIEGVRRVPYQLPELLEAVAADRVIWITEGEKDVEALTSRPGIAATCNSGGAGKWLPEFAQHFHGADVDIVADRDEQGRKHAELVVSTLMPVARSVRVLQARHGKDAADHFAAGGHTGNFITVWEPKPYNNTPGVA